MPIPPARFTARWASHGIESPRHARIETDTQHANILQIEPLTPYTALWMDTEFKVHTPEAEDRRQTGLYTPHRTLNPGHGTVGMTRHRNPGHPQEHLSGLNTAAHRSLLAMPLSTQTPHARQEPRAPRQSLHYLDFSAPMVVASLMLPFVMVWVTGLIANRHNSSE